MTNDYCAIQYDSVIVSDLCPVALFYATSTDSSLLIQNETQFAHEWTWTYGDGSIDSTPIPSHTYLNEGEYQVELIASNDFCNDTIIQWVTIDFCPIADFTVSIEDQDITLQSTSLYSDVLFWSPGFGDEVFGGEVLNLTFPNTGMYTVQLIAYNSQGCSDTLQQDISIGLNTSTTNYQTGLYQEVILASQKVFIYDNSMLFWTNLEGQYLGNTIDDFNQLSPGMYILHQQLGKDIIEAQKVLKY